MVEEVTCETFGVTESECVTLVVARGFILQSIFAKLLENFEIAIGYMILWKKKRSRSSNLLVCDWTLFVPRVRSCVLVRSTRIFRPNRNTGPLIRKPKELNLAVIKPRPKLEARGQEDTAVCLN